MTIVNKQIHGKKGRIKILEGINEAVDVVGSTIGARGRNVILEQSYGSPFICNDGVTIIRDLQFEDPLKNIGVQLLKDASAKTNLLAGDGTTSTAVLARAIIVNGWEKSDVNPVVIRKEIEAASQKVQENLKEMVEEVTTKEQAIQIATVSVQDTEIGHKIGKLMHDIGSNGAVTIKNAIELGVFIEKEAGMRLDGQLVAGVVENPDKAETKLSKPHVLILRDSPEDHEFEEKWVKIISQFTEADHLPSGKVQIKKVHVPTLLVVAESLSRRLIMFMNQNKSIIKWVWFKPSAEDKDMKEVYEDIRSMVGGKIVSEEDGVFLTQMGIDDMGKAETATINRHELVITMSQEQLKSEELLDRINVVRGQMENADDQFEKIQIKERYANLTGGVASIRVNAATSQDTLELKLRIEDSINATRSAMEEGYLPGGGIALLNASQNLCDSDGADVVRAACEAPVRQILHNAGYLNADEILDKLKQGEGMNVLTNEIVDMKEAGVIDPLKVVRLSLINAVSVGGLLLTSEYAVTNENNETERVKNFFNEK